VKRFMGVGLSYKTKELIMSTKEITGMIAKLRRMNIKTLLSSDGQCISKAKVMKTLSKEVRRQRMVEEENRLAVESANMIGVPCVFES